MKAKNVLLQDITVINQDDCVAVSGGASNVTVRNASCDGSHGLSIGSVGSQLFQIKTLQLANQAR